MCQHLLLKGLSGLLAQSLEVCGIAARTHGSRVVGREFFFFDFNFWVISRY